MKKLEALLFDCDGVICETERDGHRVSFNKAFEKEGVDANWDEELYGHLVKISGGKERMAHYFSKDTQKYLPKKFTPEYIAQMHKLKTQIFTELCGRLPARPGVVRLMREAHAKGLPIFICSTSSEKSVSAIAKSVLGDDFEKVITKIYAGDIVKAKKPAPDIYILPQREYDINPENCIVVEDTDNGLRAARAAGMNCLITVSVYSVGEEFNGALAVVNCLGDEGNPSLPIAGSIGSNTKIITLSDLEGLL